jgi:hypothetical protein
MPKYAHINVNGNNGQCERTKKASIRCRLNQELKFLYIKKQKLNITPKYIYVKANGNNMKH